MTARRPSTFASLRIRNYRLYLGGQAISVVGSWMQNIAVGWLVLELTGSGTILGIVTAAKFVPLVVLGPWGGLVADRVDNRKLLIWTQVIQAALTAALAALVWSGAATVPLLVALVFTTGLVNVLDGPSRPMRSLSTLSPSTSHGSSVRRSRVCSSHISVSLRVSWSTHCPSAPSALACCSCAPQR